MSWEGQTRDVIKPRLEPDFEKVADLYCVLVYKVRVQILAHINNTWGFHYFDGLIDPGANGKQKTKIKTNKKSKKNRVTPGRGGKGK